MHLDLVDVLRCPAPHADGWLVCAAGTVRGRELVTGRLGCPTCRAEFPVVDGVVWAAEPGVAGAVPDAAPAPEEAEVLRLAALLDLTTPDRLVVLAGRWGAFAEALAALVPVRLVLVDAPGVPAAVEGRPVVALRGVATLPLARGAVHGVALDADHAGPAWLASAAAVLRPGGRLVQPVGLTPPEGVVPLAADGRDQVGVRAVSPTAPVPIRRGGR